MQPFDRRYSQSQQAGGGMGGQGQQQDEISQRQKEIIVSTWNLIREEQEGRRNDPAYVSDNAALLSRVQSTLREQVETLARRTEARQLTASAEEIVDHPLADRPYVAADVSGDGTSAVGMTLDGEFEVLALPEGVVTDRFGYAAPRAASVPQPITLDETGRIAVSVGRLGTVSMWWVGDDEPLLSLAGDGGPARTAPAERALRSATAILPESWALSSASAVEPEARRVALRLRASPGQPTVWRIFDIDIDGWIERACALGDRPLSEEERQTLGLAEAIVACSGP